ncbi:DUF1674 domain-containing protein [Jannaschia aquimarina]|uniref:DUF1674 domain-containing protein n=1 Tax=Jannaschia aquimarina TaxID=935700 RepID=A0A0D1EF11_9RHOB|nr:DUF1674 domain-containing protein [Jannaschia aquimarina]KIT15481.1 hypothetical protein jaqu_27290 [Jannaschia aquimarina]SNT33972.1 hypothetical protein SAMN05421775_11210 [Jannaschia aquimarina]
MQRMTVDPADLPQASEDAPACPTAPRHVAETPAPLTPEQEAARRAALPPAARRALEEAEARRNELPDLPVELGGRDGPEPVRYGDWEKKGLAIDF